MPVNRFSRCYLSRSPEDTRLFGESLASRLKPGDIIGFRGELGAGKTICIQGICRKLSVKESVTSSSFVLLRPLQGIFPVYHFDLYRLSSPAELEDLGYEEFIFSDGISLIEWPEKLGTHIGEEYLLVQIEYVPQERQCRIIGLCPSGDRYLQLVSEIETHLAKCENSE